MDHLLFAQEYEEKQDFYQAGVHFQHAASEKDDVVLYLRALENFEKKDDVWSLELCIGIDKQIKEDQTEHKKRLLELYVRDEPQMTLCINALAREMNEPNACLDAYFRSHKDGLIADNLDWYTFIPIAVQRLQQKLEEKMDKHWQEYIHMGKILVEHLPHSTPIKAQRYLEANAYFGTKAANWYAATQQWDKLEETHLSLVNVFAQLGNKDALEQAQNFYVQAITQRAHAIAQHTSMTTRYEASLKRIERDMKPKLPLMGHFFKKS